MLLCMPEAVEGELCLFEVLEVLKVGGAGVTEGMRRMLLCMLEVVEGGL